MIAHLFGKVYLNFDINIRPAYNTLTLSKNHLVHDSFLHQHIGMGQDLGRYNTAAEVDWTRFFNSVPDTRTVIYADALNFPVVYFSFLRTLNSNITYDNVVKIIEIVLKRAEFYLIDYDNFGGHMGPDQKTSMSQMLAHTGTVDPVTGINTSIRSNYREAWALSSPWILSDPYLINNMGLEHLMARYWVDGSNLDVIKQRLEHFWWKSFIQWGEESMKNYSQRWMHQHPGATFDQFVSTVSADPELSWMGDPNLSLEKSKSFVASHDWSTAQSIYQWLLSDQDNGLIIELHEQWTLAANQDWDAVLDQSNPINLIAIGTEATARMFVNTWLISYFAAQSREQLGAFIR